MKKLLIVSSVAALLSTAAIEAALKGYKTGANKFGLGAMMKPIATPMSDDDIKAVAEYIQTLK